MVAPTNKYAMSTEIYGPQGDRSDWAGLEEQQHEYERPKGWRYKRVKLGPIKLPYYASPEAQLLLVSFVCFLCPGKADKTTTGSSRILTVYRHVQRPHWSRRSRTTRQRREPRSKQCLQLRSVCYFRCGRLLCWHCHERARYQNRAFVRWSRILRLRQLFSLLQPHP